VGVEETAATFATRSGRVLPAIGGVAGRRDPSGRWCHSCIVECCASQCCQTATTIPLEACVRLEPVCCASVSAGFSRCGRVAFVVGARAADDTGIVTATSEHESGHPSRASSRAFVHRCTALRDRFSVPTTNIGPECGKIHASAAGLDSPSGQAAC